MSEPAEEILANKYLSRSGKAARLVSECGLDVDAAAERVGITRSAVYVELRRTGLSKRAPLKPQHAALSLSTAERVALCGPLRFGDRFDRSAAAQGLEEQGIITKPPSNNLPALLTAYGLEVRKYALAIQRKRA